MKHLLIFDFGGVLMKTQDYTPRHNWDDRLGLPHGSVESIVHNAGSWIKAQTGVIPVEAYWDDVRQSLGISADQVQQLAIDFYSGDVLDDSLVDLIHRYRAEGHTVALLSNDSLELMPKLRRLNLVDLFDPLVVSAQIGVMKPAVAAYQALLDQANRPANEAVFIDDRAENIAGAEVLGIRGVHYQASMDLENALSSITGK